MGWRLVNGFSQCSLHMHMRDYCWKDAYLKRKKRGYLLIKMVIALNSLLFVVGKSGLEVS